MWFFRSRIAQPLARRPWSWPWPWVEPLADLSFQFNTVRRFGENLSLALDNYLKFTFAGVNFDLVFYDLSLCYQVETSTVEYQTVLSFEFTFFWFTKQVLNRHDIGKENYLLRVFRAYVYAKAVKKVFSFWNLVCNESKLRGTWWRSMKINLKSRLWT